VKLGEASGVGTWLDVDVDVNVEKGSGADR
jgi:hypothetical protein